MCVRRSGYFKRPISKAHGFNDTVEVHAGQLHRKKKHESSISSC